MKFISDADYSQLVGIMGERNRPSGGIKTVHEVIVQCSLNANMRVLEIGSNTGFTSVQISRLSGAHVTGIDINDQSIEKAYAYASEHHVDTTVNFINASATELPFDDASFDMVWASNVTSFISNKEKAINEYLRVLKPNGYLVFVPIYYINKPPEELIIRVGKAIGTDLKAYTKKSWLDMINGAFSGNDFTLDLVYDRDYRYHDQELRLEEYIEAQTNKIKGVVPSDAFMTISKRYSDHIRLFNENLKYAGYSTLIFQKNDILEDPELFITYEA